MPRKNDRPSEGRSLVELIVQHLDGAPASPTELARLRRAARASPEAGSSASEASLSVPGLTKALEGEAARFARRALPVWALLAVAGAHDPVGPKVAEQLLAGVWVARESGPRSTAGTDPALRVLSVPLVLLHPSSRDPRPFEAAGSLTWRELTLRCSMWFQDHLRRAEGRDELANWVLVRLPRVWMVPDRPSGPAQDGGTSVGLTLADQADRWLPASDEDLGRRPRRPPRPRETGPR